MSTALVHVPLRPDVPTVTGRFESLKELVLKGVVSVHSKRNYAKALDELQAFCVDRQAMLSRSLLLDFRSVMLDRELSPSTINVKLSAIRSLIGEARRAGVLGAEDASQMTDIPNVQQQGTRLRGTG